MVSTPSQFLLYTLWIFINIPLIRILQCIECFTQKVSIIDKLCWNTSVIKKKMMWNCLTEHSYVCRVNDCELSTSNWARQPNILTNDHWKLIIGLLFGSPADVTQKFEIISIISLNVRVLYFVEHACMIIIMPTLNIQRHLHFTIPQEYKSDTYRKVSCQMFWGF